MAMYPNATRGYMPFVTSANKRNGKHSKNCKHACSQKNSSRNSTSTESKTYRVTLRYRNGFTYTYMIQADGTKSLPVLCESKVTGPNGFSSSLPNLAEAALTGKMLYLPQAEAKQETGKKGLFTSLLQYIRKRTKSVSGSSKPKSKRKPKPAVQRKRQRTVSTMSNLDPIQESPEEDSEADADSYTHDSVSSTGSETDSVKDSGV